jgi:hypothetical protein
VNKNNQGWTARIRVTILCIVAICGRRSRHINTHTYRVSHQTIYFQSLDDFLDVWSCFPPAGSVCSCQDSVGKAPLQSWLSLLAMGFCWWQFCRSPLRALEVLISETNIQQVILQGGDFDPPKICPCYQSKEPADISWNPSSLCFIACLRMLRGKRRWPIHSSILGHSHWQQWFFSKQDLTRVWQR